MSRPVTSMVWVLLAVVSIAYTIPLNWLKNTKVLKNSLKKFYHKTIESKNSSVSVDVRPFGPLDYPGNDTKKLDIIHKLWQEYYDCLGTKASALSVLKIVPPYAVAAFADTSIELDCAVCVSPEEMAEKADWYVSAEPLDPNPIMVEEDEHKQIVPYSFSLLFMYLRPFHEGIYNCQLKNEQDAPHFLHVLSSITEPTLEVKSKSAKVGPFELDPVQLTNSKLVLWPDWSEWSKCSFCDEVGTKYKVGYCKISLLENLAKSIQDTVQHPLNESVIPANVIKETEQLLSVFIFGIPCRSALLPKEVLNDTNVKNYPTQVLNSFCKEYCPKNVLVEVLDKDGEIYKIYNNSAGEYYSKQDLPQKSVQAVRVTLYATPTKPFVMPCPSPVAIMTPVEWSVGGKILMKDDLESVTNKRMTLSELDEIIFERVEEVDAKIYSCWSNKVQVGVVRLLLNEPPNFLEEYLATVEMYPLIMTSTLTFALVYVAFTLCLNRQRARVGALVRTKPKPKLMKMIEDAYHDKVTEAPRVRSAVSSESE